MTLHQSVTTFLFHSLPSNRKIVNLSFEYNTLNFRLTNNTIINLTLTKCLTTEKDTERVYMWVSGKEWQEVRIMNTEGSWGISAFCIRDSHHRLVALWTKHCSKCQSSEVHLSAGTMRQIIFYKTECLQLICVPQQKSVVQSTNKMWF